MKACLLPHLALAGLLGPWFLVGCTPTVKVEPIKVEPIHIVVDVNITVDEKLDEFFDFEDDTGFAEEVDDAS